MDDEIDQLLKNLGLQRIRYNRKSTLITTNLDYDDWYGFLGRKEMVGALRDRLRHRSRTLKVDGPSLRTPQQARPARLLDATGALDGRVAPSPFWLPVRRRWPPGPRSRPPRHPPRSAAACGPDLVSTGGPVLVSAQGARCGCPRTAPTTGAARRVRPRRRGR